MRKALTPALLLAATLVQNGCGTGGYAGNAITSLSASSITLDAGQSMVVGVNGSGNLPLRWTLSGTTCSGETCGTLSSATPASVTYSAPAVVSVPSQMKLDAAVDGTKSVRTVSINANPAPAISGNPPSGTVGTAYSFAFTTTGGTAPTRLSLQSGTIPAGLAFDPATGRLTGTPTAAGVYTFRLQLLDSSDVPNSISASERITINTTETASNLSVVTTSVPTGTVSTTYTTTLQASGGTLPYSWSLIGGPLPAGLTLNQSGILSGTPTAPGTTPFAVQVTDAAGNIATAGLSIKVVPATQSSRTITFGTLLNGTIHVPYLSPHGITGGIAPYTCTLVSGQPPAGLALNADCSITGTPTTATTSTFIMTVTDSGSPAQSITGPQTITILPAPLSLSSGVLPNGVVNVAYTAAVAVTGGTAPYSCALVSGTMPAGLTLNPNCSATGTPTVAGTSSVNIRVTDSANPSQSTTGLQTITINAPAPTLSNGTLPNGTVNVVYSAPVGVTGGTAPYTCSLANGTLPQGLGLNANCSVTGTPAIAGTRTFNVLVTDSGNPAQSTTGPQTITITSSALTLSNGTLPNGTVNVAYSAPVGVAGGTAPYTCSLASGTLPSGLTLNANCSVIGTPATAGTRAFNVLVTDSSSPTQSITGSQTITIDATPLLTLSSPPAATVNQAYTGTIPVAGGTAPYTCTLTNGTLPAGLTLNTNCTLTGTPAAAGTQTITVQATDSSNPARTGSGDLTVTINPDNTVLTFSDPPAATQNTAYTGMIAVNGGTAPYTCTLASGTMPTGLSLNADCSVTGTPTMAGSTAIQVTATDSKTPARITGTDQVTITVQATQMAVTGTTPNAVVNQPYSQPMQASGGVAPYTYAITSGALPDGLSLSLNGVLSGTPTTAGASSFVVTATDSAGVSKTASLPLVLLVTYAPGTNNALLTGPYAFLFQGYDDVVSGVLAYKTATVGSIVANGNGVITSGEQDTNHQAPDVTGGILQYATAPDAQSSSLSNPSSSTVVTRGVIGTYQIGSDRRGFLTLTTLNADGTTVRTRTYAIALRAPVAPANNATSGSLIEFDNNQMVGTKGSGSLFAQTASALSTGLDGSYAFGLSGDTPCLPSCTIGIQAGSVATVGQFTAAASAITGGSSDTDIGNVAIANSALSGSYTAADAFGRVQLSLASAQLVGLPFPTNYAAYVVDGNHVLLMSTDTHATYILQAGTAEIQTQPTFSNASLNSGYVGWENSALNPTLLNTSLQSVLNLSTAMIFRGSGNGTGSCNTSNVDYSGTSNVVNVLAGLVDSLRITTLLGSYQRTGDSACTVAANGRAVLDYPSPGILLTTTLAGLGLPTTPASRVAYLSAPNQGYFLETGYATLGRLEAQSSGPFSNADLNGTYAYGTLPASTLATVNSSGIIVADGNGNAAIRLDRNAGVGTINVLQVGVTLQSTYNLTSATAGRFLLSTGQMIYEIQPGRFVLLQPDLLNTSAYVSVLF